MLQGRTYDVHYDFLESKESGGLLSNSNATASTSELTSCLVLQPRGCSGDCGKAKVSFWVVFVRLFLLQNSK